MDRAGVRSKRKIGDNLSRVIVAPCKVICVQRYNSMFPCGSRSAPVFARGGWLV